MMLFKGEKSCKDIRPPEWIHLIVSLLNNCGYLSFVGFLMYKYPSESDHYVFCALILIKFGKSPYLVLSTLIDNLI